MNFKSLSSFTILTHNILGPLTQDVTHFGFIKADYKRLDKILSNVLQIDADIVCLQEFDMYAWDRLDTVIKNLINQKYQCVSFQTKGNHGGVIVYCKNNWNILQSGHIKAYGHKLGACAWGILESDVGKKILVANIHLSRKADRGDNNCNTQIGYEQWQEILPELLYVEKQYSCPVVLLGDFNTLYEEVMHDTLIYISKKFHKTFRMYEHESWTHSNAKARFASMDHCVYVDLKLDYKHSWVGQKGNPYKDVDNVIIATQKEKIDKSLIHKSGYYSDHLPMFMRFEFKNKK